MYCTCGAPWCDARSLCSVDLGTSMGRGHRKVREGGDATVEDWARLRSMVEAARLRAYEHELDMIRARQTSQALRMVDRNLRETETGSHRRQGYIAMTERELDVIYPPS